jgi:hypothetical protein
MRLYGGCIFRAWLGTLGSERPIPRGDADMLTSWVRPKQAPDDEIEVFGLGEPDAEDDTGDTLGGRYELLEVLACGATATVYRATRPHHPVDGRGQGALQGRARCGG